MKSLRIISWILVITALIFKLLHIPFSGPLIVLGALLLFIHAIFFLIKNIETNLTDVFYHLNISIWTIYFTFRIMYWHYAQIVFIVCVLFTLTYIILLGINKSKISYLQIILFCYIFSLGVLAYTRPYRIYYFFNLNSVLNEETNKLNYHCWDKYSWFLYGADKIQEALEANQYAKSAAIEVSKTNPEIIKSIILIEEHKNQIITKNWINYTQPL